MTAVLLILMGLIAVATQAGGDNGKDPYGACMLSLGCDSATQSFASRIQAACMVKKPPK